MWYNEIIYLRNLWYVVIRSIVMADMSTRMFCVLIISCFGITITIFLIYKTVRECAYRPIYIDI
jgi:hypothetical protein